MGRMAGHWRNISTLTGATFLSRVLGLGRDVAIFAALGAGAVNSAFILGFTLPNLFRRLLGEGAMTSALVPVLSQVQTQAGEAAYQDLLNRVLSRVLVLALLLTAAGMAILWPLSTLEGLEERYPLGAKYGALLLPYMPLVCLAALVSAALNVRGRFVAAAFSQVWLNLAMIGSVLLAVTVFPKDLEARVYVLCAGVLVGGLFQLGVPAWDLRRTGWRPVWQAGVTEPVRQVTRLLVPGLAGAAIFQVNILVSRLLSFSLNDEAASLLYLGNRLLELPLGLFAVSVSTVFFPLLAAQQARGEAVAFGETYRRGLWLMLAVTIPAAAGLWVVREPIVRALFQWGLFAAEDVVAAAGPVGILALGMPFFAWSSWATRAFHARQDMRSPVRLAALNLGVNLGLSLLLMRPLGIEGLAWANTLAAAAHALLLTRRLRLQVEAPLPVRRYGLPVAVGTAVMAVVAWAGATALAMLGLETKLEAVLTAALVVPLAAALYLGLLKALGFAEFPRLPGLRRGRAAAQKPGPESPDRGPLPRG